MPWTLARDLAEEVEKNGLLNAKRRIMSVAQVCSINFGTVQEQAVLRQQSTPA